MENASKMAAFDELKPYTPTWLRGEKPIKVVDGEIISAELYENDGEIGVMLSSPSNIEFEKGNAAIIFAESSEDLYLRTAFSTVVKISCNDGNRQTFERLSKAKIASFNWWDGKVHRNEGGIPVFHDEGDVKQFVHCNESASMDDDTDECKIRETPSGMLLLPAPGRDDDEIATAVDAEITARNGVIMVRHKNEMRDRYSYDVAIVGKRCFVMMYFGLKGDWLGEEESFNGDPPLWFSEIDHTISPVFFAQKWRELARGKTRRLQVFPIVIASGGNSIINEDEMEDIWKNTCHVGVVRTKTLNDSALPGLKDYLDLLPAPNGSPKAIHPETIVEINEDFLRNYWK